MKTRRHIRNLILHKTEEPVIRHVVFYVGKYHNLGTLNDNAGIFKPNHKLMLEFSSIPNEQRDRPQK